MSVQFKCRFKDTAGVCSVDIKLREKSRLLRLPLKAKASVSLDFSVMEECEYVFNELHVEASKLLNGRPVELQYKDDDGDMITMGTVPEFAECLKCVRLMGMELRIFAVPKDSRLMNLTSKKVKFTDAPKRHQKFGKIRVVDGLAAAAATTSSSDDSGESKEKEVPLPQWLLKLSEELKRQLKAELLEELRAELNVAPKPQEPAIDVVEGMKRRKHRSAVDKLIKKLEKKLDKRMNKGGSSSSAEKQTETTTVDPLPSTNTTAEVKLICENFVQEVVDMSNKQSEIQKEPEEESYVTPADVVSQSKETSPETPNNTPCGTTPLQSHPQTPRSASPLDLQQFHTSAVESLNNAEINAETQQDKLISFSSDGEDDSDADDEDKFSCVSCKSDTSLMSDEFELVPLTVGLTDEQLESLMTALDSSDASGRSSGFCFVENSTAQSPEEAVADFVDPQLIPQEANTEVQLSSDMVKETTTAAAEATVPVNPVDVVVPSTTVNQTATGVAAQFDLWRPPALWTPPEQQTAVSEMPWSGAANCWIQPRRLSSDVPIDYSDQMGRLFDMGFFNRELNQQLITKHQGEANLIDQVVNDLITHNN